MTKKTRRAKARRALLALSLVLVTMMVAVGGTIAWLTAESGTVTNTFSPSGIDITLVETTTNQFDLIPGYSYAKDPTVTVEGGSEACWLFVEMTVSDELADILTYDTILDETPWTLVAGPTTASGKTTNVYAIEVPKSETDTAYELLKNSTVSIAGTALTKDNMPSVDQIMEFKAYASQLYKNNTEKFEADEAWAIANQN